MRATGNYCWMRPVCDEESKGGEMVADLLNTAGAALPLLLISTRSQLLLSHCHLLLHVADLLLGPATVFLEKQHEWTRREWWEKNKENITRCSQVDVADESWSARGTLHGQKYEDTWILYLCNCHGHRYNSLSCNHTSIQPQQPLWLRVKVPIHPIGVQEAEVRAVRFLCTRTPFLYGSRFVNRGIDTLKQERAFPKLSPQSWKHTIV